MVSRPSPAAITSVTIPKRTPCPRRWPMARRGVSTGALSLPDGSSQVRCAPVIEPACLARGAVVPVAGGAFATPWPGQADEEAAAGCFCDIADQPVAAVAATIGEVMAAHRLSITREAAGEFGRLGGHGAHLTRPP